MVQPMSARISELARSGRHREHQNGVPDPYKPDAEPGVRKRVIAMLDNCRVMNLTTVAPNNWPITSCVPYVTLADAADRPVLYVFVGLNSQDAVDVRHSSKVSLAADINQEPQNFRKAQGIQAQGLAEIVDDSIQWTDAIAAVSGKRPALVETFTRATHALIRIDVLSALFYDVKVRPVWGSIDFMAA